MKQFRIIAVGGNNEVILTRCGKKDTLRSLSENDELVAKFTRARTDAHPLDISCEYYSWTGTDIFNTWWIPLPPFYFWGELRIVCSECRHLTADATVVVGWSNGGATAYGVAEKLGENPNYPVVALITLDPVSRLTKKHKEHPKPSGVAAWFNVVPTKHEPYIGNLIAKVGGAWNHQSQADQNIRISANHGDVSKMLTEVLGHDEFKEWLKSV